MIVTRKSLPLGARHSSHDYAHRRVTNEQRLPAHRSLVIYAQSLHTNTGSRTCTMMGAALQTICLLPIYLALIYKNTVIKWPNPGQPTPSPHSTIDHLRINNYKAYAL